MKFLILGATGMAGHTISLYLYEKGYDVTAFSMKPFPFIKNINGDATDKRFIVSMIQESKYDVVINCIGILNQECDRNPTQAIYLNSYLPYLVADAIQNTQTKLIHMSTDCVFSGKEGPYFENSFRDGDTLYDRTKALGEVIDDKNLTFRNSIVGPDMKENGIGLLNWFLKQKKSLVGYTKAFWTGVTTLTLAKAIEMAVIENLSGLYHLVNNESICKFDLLKLFNKHLRNDDLAISQCESVKVNKSLVNTRKDFSFIVPSYEQMVIEMKEWIFNHKDLYPHYFN